ncbi:hypothetical protein BJ912DRAFT_1067421 [Pholiota molesta]|nr:hypothetical protein BJ912DRAFT_1067421 [Pholiota molesta]
MSTAVIADPPVLCHPRPLRLEFLEFTMSESAIKGLLDGIRPSRLPFFNLSQLREFIVRTSSPGTVDDGVRISRLLRGMSKLKNLVISAQQRSIPPNFPDVFNSIHPEAAAKLEFLSFHLWYNPIGGPTHHQLPAAILQNTRTFPSLKDLGILICIVLPIIDRSPVIDDLMALDNLLSTQKFSSLKSLSMILLFIGANTHTDDGKWVDIPVLMPQCYMNPALKFQFSSQLF